MTTDNVLYEKPPYVHQGRLWAVRNANGWDPIYHEPGVGQFSTPKLFTVRRDASDFKKLLKDRYDWDFEVIEVGVVEIKQ